MYLDTTSGNGGGGGIERKTASIGRLTNGKVELFFCSTNPPIGPPKYWDTAVLSSIHRVVSYLRGMQGEGYEVVFVRDTTYLDENIRKAPLEEDSERYVRKEMNL